MKTLIHRLASMKIAVFLLASIVLALAAGTIVESVRGSQAAMVLVYQAPWFRLLLALFALNIACSLVDLFPWGRERIGFVLTHGSLLVILAGGLATDRLKEEGRLALWEGEESSVFAAAPAAGGSGASRSLSLPFSVRLDAFEIDYYQGTRRPAMFRSRVTVRDPGRDGVPAVIEMNRELAHAGYRLYQSGYQQTAGRDQTVLLVSRDPGRPIVFAGYGLLLAGMATVLLTRLAQQRALARKVGARDGRALRRAAALLAGSLLAGFPHAARAATLVEPAAAEALRSLPVQHDGRVMPLDTLAREAIWQVTGRSGWGGVDPVALVLGWTFDPAGWSGVPLVRIGGSDLAASLGLGASASHASYAVLARNDRLMALLQQAHAAADQERPVAGPQRSALKLEERLVVMQGFLNRTTLTVLPSPADPRAPWSVPASLESPEDLLSVLRAGSSASYAPAGAMTREILYNRVGPTRVAWWTLLAALLASLVVGGRRRLLRAIAAAGLVLGFAVMTWGLAMRWAVAGRIPASNMYESLLFLGWGVGLFALVALVIIRSPLVVQNATAMSALTMMLADLLPIDPFIHPMPPVLSGTAWLAIHVPIIMLSYSVLALGVCVAHVQIGWEIARPARRDIALRLNEMLYWYIEVGALLLIAGILTGSIWAASSWGRYWGWDPKEVWSLIAFLAYLAILHSRFDRMIGTFGVAALSIVAFWTILMTYVGVNFVLAAGLHSYGFGGSGVVRWLLIVASFEGLFITLGILAHRSRLSRTTPVAA